MYVRCMYNMGTDVHNVRTLSREYRSISEYSRCSWGTLSSVGFKWARSYGIRLAKARLFLSLRRPTSPIATHPWLAFSVADDEGSLGTSRPFSSTLHVSPRFLYHLVFHLLAKCSSAYGALSLWLPTCSEELGTEGRDVRGKRQSRGEKWSREQIKETDQHRLIRSNAWRRLSSKDTMERTRPFPSSHSRMNCCCC